MSVKFKPILWAGIAALTGSIAIAQGAHSQETLAQSPAAETGVAAPRQEEAPFSRFMRLGYAAMQWEDYQSAASYFRSALYERPDDRDATIAYWNAVDKLRADEPGNAATGEESIYDRNMRLGYEATDAGSYDAAVGYFEEALTQKPEDYFAVQALRNVQTYIERGQQESLPAEAQPDSIYIGESPYDRYMRLGYAAMQRDEFTAASDHFRSALNERPNDRNATIAFWNAKDQIRGGKVDKTASGESDYDRLMRLGYDATERGKFQTAAEYFTNALEERPDDYYATQSLRNVRTYITRGEDGAAVTQPVGTGSGTCACPTSSAQ